MRHHWLWSITSSPEFPPQRISCGIVGSFKETCPTRTIARKTRTLSASSTVVAGKRRNWSAMEGRRESDWLEEAAEHTGQNVLPSSADCISPPQVGHSAKRVSPRKSSYLRRSESYVCFGIERNRTSREGRRYLFFHTGLR